MKRTRVKICGITRLEDAQAAIAAGVDALGFVFYAPSPRYIEPAKAAAIIQQLPPFVTITALFVNASAEYVKEVLAICAIDLLQFHGDEDAAYAEQFSHPYIKALKMQPGLDMATQCQNFSSARAILLDTYHPQIAGGTGEVFDWRLIPANLSQAIILAGGLSAANVKEAICLTQVYAVDVSGGVERSKGIKDSEKILKFMQEVYSAE